MKKENNRCQGNLLIVDDDRKMREMICQVFSVSNYNIKTAEDGLKALEAIKSNCFDVVITDMVMPNMGGIELLRMIRKLNPETVTIMITAHGAIESAVEAMRQGAFHYLTKPLEQEKLRSIVNMVMDSRRLVRENNRLKMQLEDKNSGPLIIGNSTQIIRTKSLIDKIAPSDITVLIQGESGTGKELVARSIHQKSKRAKNNFVAINCAAIPHNLLESELFGYNKGAFTGADQQKKGLFEEADQGTLFLDEISEIDIQLQAKLLRALQEGEIRRLGSNSDVKVDVRIIAASNQDLKKMQSEGKMRQDLFYRLNVMSFVLPPLRERRGDIPLLASYFLDTVCHRNQRERITLGNRVVTQLLKYSWPGNIRELQSAIECGVIMCDGRVLKPEHIPLEQGNNQVAEKLNPYDLEIPAEGIDLEQVEICLIKKALERADGKYQQAASLLGLSYKTMIYRAKKYQLKNR